MPMLKNLSFAYSDMTINYLAAKAELALGEGSEEHSFVGLMVATFIAKGMLDGEELDIDYHTRGFHKSERKWIKRKIDDIYSRRN